MVTFVQLIADSFRREFGEFPHEYVLRALAPGLRFGVRMIVTYLGTKGGTGTTTLAVNGAADIRRMTGRSTVVVDLKSGTGDVALFLGLRPRYSVLTALDHHAWVDTSMLGRFVVEHACGLHVLAAGEDFSRPAARDAEHMEHLLRALNAAYEYVVIDAGCTLVPPATTAIQLSDAILLIANPDVPCLRNLQRIIDAVKTVGVARERLKIVLNRASEFGVLSMAQIERVIGLSIAHNVNSDYRSVASAVNSGVPVSALRVTELNSQLEAIAGAITGSPDRPSRRRILPQNYERGAEV